MCNYLRRVSRHHPLLSGFHLVVGNGTLAEAPQRVEHGVLHLAEPVLHVALSLQAFRQTHLRSKHRETSAAGGGGCILHREVAFCMNLLHPTRAARFGHAVFTGRSGRKGPTVKMAVEIFS